ncbi:MAG TPA: hypothetical protein PKD16_10785 [Saprospiraceae bacterium]|nr:hypothetical protein [Saprospiraceae bacterium]HMT70639.1 hypothetical protein [Saprospiraceae bacterium]
MGKKFWLKNEYMPASFGLRSDLNKIYSNEWGMTQRYNVNDLASE